MTTLSANTSALADPSIIETLDFDVIYSARKEAFIAMWDVDQRQEWRDTLELESEPVTKLIQENAYLEMLFRARVNEAARSNFLAYAENYNLDRLADFYGVTRFVNESDNDFRQRITLKIRASSTAGPPVYYRYHALNASDNVADVHVDSPRPGLVRISVIAKDGEPSDDLLQQVDSYLNQTDVKVLTDTLIVTKAVVTGVDINATIYLLPTANPSILDNLEQRLHQAVGSELGLGRDLTRSWLIHTLHVMGVQRVELSSPVNDIKINNDQAAQINTVQLIMGGRDY